MTQSLIRVLVVDDSATARALLSGMLERDPGIQVVGHAGSGAEAVDAARRLQPSLITMDVHMPGMDGLEATRQIMSLAPTPIVIVTSMVVGPEVNLPFEATAAGALTLVAKPQGPASPNYETERTAFVSLIRTMSQVKVVRRWKGSQTPGIALPAVVHSQPRSAQVVAIAASTGGPAVLMDIVKSLPADFGLPLLVVQHIARGFSQGLVDWLDSGTSLRVRIAEEGEMLSRGTVYFAPEDRHLGVSAGGRISLSDSAAIGGFRPSGTFLFESVAKVFGRETAVLILSGMGRDGVDGLRSVHERGGQIVAQSESTSVVYGMPGEAVATGLVDTILPSGQMGKWLIQLGVRMAA